MRIAMFQGQSGASEVPSGITEAVSNAVGGVPTYVIFALAALILTGVVVIMLKARGSNLPED